MKTNKRKDGFFVSAFSISIIVLLIVLNLSLLFGPAALWFFTGKWPWVFLYFVTLPIALFFPAGIQRYKRSKDKE